VESDSQELGDGFAVLQALCQHPQRQRLHLGDSIGLGHTVGRNAREGGDFGNPAAVGFLLELDVEGHGVSGGSLQFTMPVRDRLTTCASAAGDHARARTTLRFLSGATGGRRLSGAPRPSGPSAACAG